MNSTELIDLFFFNFYKNQPLYKINLYFYLSQTKNRRPQARQRPQSQQQHHHHQQ